MLRSLRYTRNTVRTMSSTAQAAASTTPTTSTGPPSASTGGNASAEPGSNPNPAPPKPTGLVMQIIVRRDLMTTLGWPVGPLMAQAAHAASAVQHLYASHPDMARYLSGDDGRGWEGMRKAVLEVADEDALRRLAAELDKGGVPHHLWIEEPRVGPGCSFAPLTHLVPHVDASEIPADASEHIPTALALVPNKRPKGVKRALEAAGATLWK